MNWLLLASLAAARIAAGQEESSVASPGLIQPGGMMIFYASEGPLSFVTPTPGELPAGALDAGEVRDRRCQHGLSIPIAAQLRPTTVSGAAGDGGYRRILEEILKKRPELAGIYDVKVDLRVLSILGFYRRTCTLILARGFRLAGNGSSGVR
ncbi:MAG TPA: hypothetical protein DEB40_04705 [Elusimicrobia bacterium]|nr:hypothetical protein [Elusimicrobiota bacterium]HBT61023.1 hypothetical protein [Elusimicrobiota bacterium]